MPRPKYISRRRLATLLAGGTAVLIAGCGDSAPPASTPDTRSARRADDCGSDNTTLAAGKFADDSGARERRRGPVGLRRRTCNVARATAGARRTGSHRCRPAPHPPAAGADRGAHGNPDA